MEIHYRSVQFMQSSDLFFKNSKRAITCVFFLAVLLAGCRSVSVPPGSYLLTGNVHQRCLDILRDGLQSDAFWPSIHAAEALIGINYGFEVKPLLLSRREEETDLRRIAGYARALITTGHERSLLDLQDILLSDDTEAKILAAEAMFRTRTIGDVTILEQAMEAQNNGRLRVFAAATLTATNINNELDVARDALRGDDPAARYIAADVIPMLSNAEVDLAVLLGTKDIANSDFEALYFVRALAVLGVESATEELITYLEHPDPTIRSRAAFAIAEAWIIDATDQLESLLDDESIAVRVRAAQALLTLSNPNSQYRYLRMR